LVQDRTQVLLLAFEFRRLAQALRLAASISPFNHSLKPMRSLSASSSMPLQLF
jgi:hypothetical protein